MKKLLLPLFAVATIMMVLGGCSSTNEPVDNQNDLKNFGSFEATDEEPYFGNANIAAEVTEGEVEFDDPVIFSPVVDSVNILEVPDIFCFRMVWGNLERDTGITTLTDWSGTLTVSRGAIVVKRLIWFEPFQDYILPRYDDEGYYVPEELGWVSKTSIHVDGIATKIFIPPSMTEEAVSITYESPQLTITFSMQELETLDTLINIGVGNSIFFQAFRFDPLSHLHGGLAGRWGRDETGNGIFYGKWISAAGLIMGSLKGEWGFDGDGNPVFAGKWIDNSGQFQGLLKGYWDVRGDGRFAIGRFWGRIFNADEEAIGVLGGYFRPGYYVQGGFFAGRWRVGGEIPEILNNGRPFE